MYQAWTDSKPAMTLAEYHALMHEAQQVYLRANEYHRKAYALEEEAKRLWRERGKEAEEEADVN